MAGQLSCLQSPTWRKPQGFRQFWLGQGGASYPHRELKCEPGKWKHSGLQGGYPPPALHQEARGVRPQPGHLGLQAGLRLQSPWSPFLPG